MYFTDLKNAIPSPDGGKIPLVGSALAPRVADAITRPAWRMPLRDSETQQNRWIVLPLMLGCAIAPPNLQENGYLINYRVFKKR